MRCITVWNPSIKNDIEYGDQPIFVVQHLEDRMFAAGFRVLNPEYNATPDRITTDTRDLREMLNRLDSQEEFLGTWQKPRSITPRQRAEMRAAAGLDR